MSKPEHITYFLALMLERKRLEEEYEKEFKENKEFFEWYFGGVSDGS